MGVMSSIDVDIQECCAGAIQQEKVRSEIQSYCDGKKMMMQLSQLSQSIIMKHLRRRRTD